MFAVVNWPDGLTAENVTKLGGERKEVGDVVQKFFANPDPLDKENKLVLFSGTIQSLHG